MVAIDREQTSPYHLTAPIIPLPEPGSADGLEPRQVRVSFL